MAQIVRYPDSPFILHQPFPPAGDQPSAIEALSEGLEDGVMFQTLLGVTGSGKTYTMANVIARLGVPALIMAPNKTLAAQTYAEMRDFFPENAVEYFVSYYDFYQPEAYVPARDLFIEKDAAVNEHIEQMRLAATKSILERRDTIIVATVSAIYGIGKPESYTEMRLYPSRGRQEGPAPAHHAARQDAVPPHRHGLRARHFPRSRRHDRRLPRRTCRERRTHRALRRRSRGRASLRSAHRPHRAEGAPLRRVPRKPLRHAPRGGHTMP